MDIDFLKRQFISDAKNFLTQIEKRAHGLDPVEYKKARECVGEMDTIWAKIITRPFDILLRLDKTTQLVHSIMKYVSSIDVSAIATAVGVSTTAKSVMILEQYHIRENGGKLFDALSAQANDFLVKNRIDSAQIIAYVQNVIDTIGKKDVEYPLFGAIIAQAITFNASVMTAEDANKLHQLLLDTSIDKLLRTTRTPIDASRPVYEQVLTTGYLIPATQSMNRNALFGIFDQQYDMKLDLSANLKKLANAIRANVVFVSMVAPITLEFDSRGLFDEKYLRKNDLLVPKFCGLCDKVLARFDTIKKLNPSRANVPHYFKYFNNFAQTLVIESLVGNLFRIMGTATQHKGGSYLIDNSACLFLLEGQSTRADEYNRRIEEQIFANGQSEFVQSVINTTEGDKRARDQMLSGIIRGKFATLMQQYAHTDKVFGANKIDDLFAMLILAYKAEQGRDVSFPSFAFFAPQLFKTAIIINNKLDEHGEELRATMLNNNFAERERVFNIVLDEATAEDMFAFTTTDNIQLLIARAKFSGAQ